MIVDDQANTRVSESMPDPLMLTESPAQRERTPCSRSRRFARPWAASRTSSTGMV